MFSYFRKKAEEKRLSGDWRLVATLEASIAWSDKIDDQGEHPTDNIFYYLRENGLGKRRCECKGTGELGNPHRQEWAKTVMKRHGYYLSKIQPWVYGGYDPDIPSYETIPAKEFKDALKGQKT